MKVLRKSDFDKSNSHFSLGLILVRFGGFHFGSIPSFHFGTIWFWYDLVLVRFGFGTIWESWFWYDLVFLVLLGNGFLVFWE